MVVYINDKATEMPEHSTLSQMLEITGQPKHIALAVNDVVIPKQQWETFMIKPEDEITIITIAQGG